MKVSIKFLSLLHQDCSMHYIGLLRNRFELAKIMLDEFGDPAMDGVWDELEFELQTFTVENPGMVLMAEITTKCYRATRGFKGGHILWDDTDMIRSAFANLPRIEEDHWLVFNGKTTDGHEFSEIRITLGSIKYIDEHHFGAWIDVTGTAFIAAHPRHVLDRLFRSWQTKQMAIRQPQEV